MAAQLLHVAVEALELGEESGVGKEAVEDADRIRAVERRDQAVAGVLDGLQVAGRDVAGGADQWRNSCTVCSFIRASQLLALLCKHFFFQPFDMPAPRPFTSQPKLEVFLDLFIAQDQEAIDDGNGLCRPSLTISAGSTSRDTPHGGRPGPGHRSRGELFARSFWTFRDLSFFWLRKNFSLPTTGYSSCFSNSHQRST